MSAKHAIVIGAGAGGLAASIDLARGGFNVTLHDRGNPPGGKMHTRAVDDREVDGGPTVLTMRSIFEQLFADAGACLSDRLTLLESPIIARHAWSHGGVLDLYPDAQRSRQSIEDFAGTDDAAGFNNTSSKVRASEIFLVISGMVPPVMSVALIYTMLAHLKR